MQWEILLDWNNLIAIAILILIIYFIIESMRLKKIKSKPIKDAVENAPHKKKK